MILEGRGFQAVDTCKSVYFLFFPTYFWCLRSRTFLLLEGYIMMFAWRCFPLLGIELTVGSLMLMGFLFQSFLNYNHYSTTPENLNFYPPMFFAVYFRAIISGIKKCKISYRQCR